jgi:hypothetical protein
MSHIEDNAALFRPNIAGTFTNIVQDGKLLPAALAAARRYPDPLLFWGATGREFAT